MFNLALHRQTFAIPTCLMSLVFVIVLLPEASFQNVRGKNDEVSIPGHNQPLGYHQPSSGKIDIVDGFLEPTIFFEKYAGKSKAVLFKGACKNFKATKEWNDETLRERYGELDVRVDQVKKENRYLPSKHMTISEFLMSYNTSNWYMIDTLPRKMWTDLEIPLSLMCGGFLQKLQDVVIWFSSGLSKSHLHMDTVENIYCMIAGRKSWFLVDKVNSEKITMDHQDGDYCSVNVDQVDMHNYPFLRDLPWWNTTIEKGDCLYVPYGWAHQVTSHLRNIAVNIWWTPMFSFNYSTCQDVTRIEKFTDLYFTPGEHYRFQLFQLVKDKGQPVNFEYMESKVVSEHTGKKLISAEDFTLLDKNEDGLVDMNEIEKVDLKDLENILDGEEPGSINLKGEFRKSPDEEDDHIHSMAVEKKDEL